MRIAVGDNLFFFTDETDEKMIKISGNALKNAEKAYPCCFFGTEAR